MGDRKNRQFTWTVDLFNEIDRPNVDTWFDLQLRGEVTETGEPIIRELHVVPKLELDCPDTHTDGPPGAFTKDLLKEVLRIFDRQSDNAVASVQMTMLDTSGVEFELARFLDGTSIRKRGDVFFAVDGDGNREVYEPRDEEEYQELARSLADSDRRRRISRQRWTDGELRKVADAYRRALSEGRSAQKAIQDEFYVSRSRACVLIRNARAANLLPPATTGRRQAT